MNFAETFVRIQIKPLRLIPSPSVDLVLIDDDPLVRATWEVRAKFQGVSVKCLESAAQLPLEGVTFDTPIYIDKMLGDFDGVDVARDLWRKGFKNLYLATGFPLKDRDIAGFSFLKGITGKEFPV